MRATLYNHTTNQGNQPWIDVVNCLVRESTYVLDGLLYPDAPAIKEHYTDTGVALLKLSWDAK